MSEPIKTMEETAKEVIQAHQMTQEQLFIEASRDEQLKIADLPWDKDPQEACQKLVARFKQLENISLEAKTRATVIAKKLRQVEELSGKNRWDKGRGSENPYNLSDPRKSPLLKKAQDKHKADLTKVEKLVSGYIDLGWSDDDIMNMFPEGKKFKGHEVREALTKLRS